MRIRSTRAGGTATMFAVVALLVPHVASAGLCLSIVTGTERVRSCQVGDSCAAITDPNQSCQIVTCENAIGCPGAPEQLGRACYTDAACGGYLTCVGAGPEAQFEGDEQSPGHCTVPEAPPPAPTIEYHPVQATLQIPIPNLEFSKLPEKLTPGITIISVPWIAQYIAAVFRWAVRVGAILAVVMIMIGGVIWMTSGATGALSKAKEMMTNAVIGLILLVGSYTTLYLVNPDLVAFRSLLIEVVQPQFLESEEEPEEVEGIEPPTDPSSIVLVEGDNLKSLQSKTTGEFTKVPQYLLLPLQQAAESLKEHDIELWVTSGFRSPELQYALIKQNCEVVNADGSSPKGTPCNPTTCRMLGGAKSCPHTTGAAVDVWGAQSGAQCMRQKQCTSATAIQRNGWDTSIDPCHTDTCQALVIDAMRDAGFCNWAGEAWHFEWGDGFSQPCQ